MQSLTIPNFSSFDKFYEIDQKFKNETKELVDDQIALIKYITCLLSLKEFRNKYGLAYKILNNLIIDFFNLNTKCFISKQAFSDIKRKKLLMSKDQILKKDIIKKMSDIDYVYLIPIKDISNELFTRKIHAIQIKNILINSTTKIILHKSQKKPIKDTKPNKEKVFRPNFKINSSEIEKIFGIKIEKRRIKLLN
jgi:hypothetical protein